MTTDKNIELEHEIKEILSRLASTETKVDMLTDAINKATSANMVAVKALEYAKSAHHRLDEHRQTQKEDFDEYKRTLKKDLDDYKASIRWTVGITITITSVAVGLIEHFI